MLDIGTGAGFPSIPLKIYHPDISVVAIDAVAKKIMFLRHLCRGLALQDVECLASRIAPISSGPGKTSKSVQQPIELRSKTFEVVVSRAVGAVPYLVNLATPFLAPGGHILLQRGQDAVQEREENCHIFKEKGLQLVEMLNVTFSFLDSPRYLMVFQRV